MVNDISPEEKLLRLIKGKGPTPSAPEEIAIPEGKQKVDISRRDKEATLAEVKKEKQPPSEIKPLQQIKVKLAKRPKLTFDIRYLYIIISGAGLLLAAVFIFSILSNREGQDLENLERMIAAISEDTRVEVPPVEKFEPPQKEKSPLETTKPPKPEASFEEYQKLLNEKSIFATPVKDRERPPLPGGPTLRDLVKQFSLVGIIPGDEPQAIIEDKKSGQTFFLKKGEQIEGIELKDISSGKVVLGYEEETVTLSL